MPLRALDFMANEREIVMNESHRIVSRKLLTALIFAIALVAFVGATSMGRYSPAIALKVALRPSESSDMLLGLCVASGRQRSVS